MTDIQTARSEADRLVEEFGPFESPEDMVALADRIAESASTYPGGPDLARAAADVLRGRAAAGMA